MPRDGNCSKSLCYLGSNNVSLTATGGYPYDDDSDTNGHGDSDTDSDKDYLWCVEANSAFDNNFTINCASNNIVGTSSNYCGNTNNFHQCTNPILDSKAPLTAGSYSFRLFVKDKTKTTSKLFSITIDNR
ncbi:MAG TPA: hypothetical protein ENK68_02155 [Epsilonproteobacteria bacterium]|nr:hypothetical protein [Campylobacterota bacterium]